MIEFVCDLQHIEGFLWVLWFPPPIYLTVTAAMITEIVLNTHNSISDIYFYIRRV
jgi:hypothetical protein